MSVLDGYAKAREKLKERRAQLIEELRQIDEALGGQRAYKPRTHRRGNSKISRVETYVREHPGCTLREAADATGFGQNVTSSALFNLVRYKRVVRTRNENDEKDVWRYSAP